MGSPPSMYDVVGWRYWYDNTDVCVSCAPDPLLAKEWFPLTREQADDDNAICHKCDIKLVEGPSEV